MTRRKPKSVRAAELYDIHGEDIDVIASEFGWTKRTASVAVCRGRRWKEFLVVQAARNKARRQEQRVEKRKREVGPEFRRLVAEARKLGVKLPEVAR